MEKEICCKLCDSEYTIIEFENAYSDEPEYCSFCGNPLLDDEDVEGLDDYDE